VTTGEAIVYYRHKDREAHWCQQWH